MSVKMLVAADNIWAPKSSVMWKMPWATLSSILSFTRLCVFLPVLTLL